MGNEKHTDIDAVRNPIVFEKDGAVFATSRDVATFFAKKHAHVLRDIDAMIESDPSLGVSPEMDQPPSFQKSSFIEPSNGQTYRLYEMDLTGFTLLAMGFTGEKALRFKRRYIAAFQAMENELRARPAAAAFDLANPAHLRALLLDYTQKTEGLSKQVEEMRPAVAALDRLANADGSLCITDAAKVLQIPPQKLFNFLRENGWIYRRAETDSYVGFQAKIITGLLEHKFKTFLRADGMEKVTQQVRVTPRGLTRLAQILAAKAPDQLQ